MKHKYEAIGAVLLAAISLALTVMIVQANGRLMWNAAGVPISAVGGNQFNPQPVSDGAGGAIISWIDGRAGLNGRIYAQRVSANGQVAWTPNGVFAISSTRAIQVFAAIGDAQNGAFIVWEDNGRGEGSPISDLMAQHVTANGAPLWATTGLTISASSADEELGGLISDGAGGGILAWNNYFDYDNKVNVYVQRFNTNGALQWGPYGVRLTPVTGHQYPDAGIATDQQYGAYVVYRNPANQVVLQRILANGNPVWAGGGITLTTEPTDAVLAIAADGSGGAIVRWGQFMQRVRSTGTVMWGATGITLTDDSNFSTFSPLLADGGGGVYVAWEFDRMSSTPSIRAQHVLSTGLLGWTANGVTVTNAIYPALVGDGRGGVIEAWQSYPYADPGEHSCWAQRIDAAGNVQWVTLIITASAATPPEQAFVRGCRMVSDQQFGAILTWRDWRNGVDGDIYAQRVLDFTATAWVYLPLVRK